MLALPLKSPTAFAALIAATLTIAACGPGHDGATAGTVTGAAVGAGAGTAIGNASGNTGTGAAIGTITGAAIGAALGDTADQSSSRTKEMDEFMIRQEQEKAKQDKEIEDLKRQQFQDGYYKYRYQGGAQ
jgi:uncharacterized protein YcfJ